MNQILALLIFAVSISLGKAAELTAGWLKTASICYLSGEDTRNAEQANRAREFEFWITGYFSGVISLRTEANEQERYELWEPEWGDDQTKGAATGLAVHVVFFDIPEKADARLTVLSWWLLNHPKKTKADLLRAFQILENIGARRNLE